VNRQRAYDKATVNPSGWSKFVESKGEPVLTRIKRKQRVFSPSPASKPVKERQKMNVGGGWLVKFAEKEG